MYSYRTKGTCSSRIDVELDGNVIKNVEVTGGCNGNLKGIMALLRGMTVEEVEEKFSGITCGIRPTSCPDQIAKAVRAAYDAQAAQATQSAQ